VDPIKLTPVPGTRIRPFSRSLPMQLLRAREALMQRFRPMLHAHGLTEQQWRVLRVLMETDAIEITELSQRTRLLAASLSRILPKLEAAQLVARRTPAEDQRRSVISVAPAGRRLFERIAPHSEVSYREIERELGTERVAALYRLLDEITDILGDAKPSDDAR
jgi:homoprotocatechuate degradation regulator HpaR